MSATSEILRLNEVAPLIDSARHRAQLRSEAQFVAWLLRMEGREAELDVNL